MSFCYVRRCVDQMYSLVFKHKRVQDSTDPDNERRTYLKRLSFRPQWSCAACRFLIASKKKKNAYPHQTLCVKNGLPWSQGAPWRNKRACPNRQGHDRHLCPQAQERFHPPLKPPPSQNVSIAPPPLDVGHFLHHLNSTHRARLFRVIESTRQPWLVSRCSQTPLGWRARDATLAIVPSDCQRNPKASCQSGIGKGSQNLDGSRDSHNGWRPLDTNCLPAAVSPIKGRHCTRPATSCRRGPLCHLQLRFFIILLHRDPSQDFFRRGWEKFSSWAFPRMSMTLIQNPASGRSRESGCPSCARSSRHQQYISSPGCPNSLSPDLDLCSSRGRRFSFVYVGREFWVNEITQCWCSTARKRQ